MRPPQVPQYSLRMQTSLAFQRGGVSLADVSVHFTLSIQLLLLLARDTEKEVVELGRRVAEKKELAKCGSTSLVAPMRRSCSNAFSRLTIGTARPAAGRSLAPISVGVGVTVFLTSPPPSLFILLQWLSAS